MALAALTMAGCAAPIPPSEPEAMVPAKLAARIPAGTRIEVAAPVLQSAAREGKAPYDELTGTFPLVQPQGLVNFAQSERLTLAAAGASVETAQGKAGLTLRTSILGAMTIPYPQAYAVLFVHYELDATATGQPVWSRNVYSQAKLQAPAGDRRAPDPAYALLAAGNLRQMITSMSDWLASRSPERVQ